MIKQNKAKILLSSAVILLPAVYGIIMWNHLPDTMAAHWGADGITMEPPERCGLSLACRFCICWCICFACG